MAKELVEAGADGLVLFNRFYQPYINAEALDVGTRIVRSKSLEGYALASALDRYSQWTD